MGDNDRIKIDTLVHSSAGLGSWFTAGVSTFLALIGWWYVIPLVPIIMAFGKETIDEIRYGGFDINEAFATLNSTIIIKWYIKLIKKE